MAAFELLNRNCLHQKYRINDSNLANCDKIYQLHFVDQVPTLQLLFFLNGDSGFQGDDTVVATDIKTICNRYRFARMRCSVIAQKNG